eukprot:m.902475 g.902475  ORF g.902475 m.902475 type:complete len:155 (-) comp23689_c3_seq67:354-818(-)
MLEDGACMFRAVAFHVFGDQEMHGQVRDQCMEYMLKNRDHFAEFVTEDFDAYIERKSHDRCFGNHLELQAMSELYNRSIEVYSYSPVPINTFQASAAGGVPMRLSYHNQIHYNAVFDPQNVCRWSNAAMTATCIYGRSQMPSWHEALPIRHLGR